MKGMYRALAFSMFFLSLSSNCYGFSAAGRVATGVAAVGEQARQEAKYKAARALYDEGKYTESYPIFLSLAQQGHAMSQYLVGHLLVYGWAGKTDFSGGIDWLTKAANSGHAQVAGFAKTELEKSGIPIPEKKAEFCCIQ